MSGGAITNPQAVDAQMYAQWVASLMAQQEPAAQQAIAAAPAIPGDRHTPGAQQGQAAPAVDLGQPALQPPPELGFDAQGRVMVLASNTPYLGLDIRVAGQSDPATGQWVPSEPLTFTDGQGNPIDLEALERQHGIGVPAAPDAAGAPAADGAAAPGAPEAPAPDEPMLDPNNANAQGHPRIVYPDGRPYQGRELYFNEQTQQILDAQGQVVDPSSLGLGPGMTDADRAAVRRIRTITTLTSGAMGIGMDYMWYRSTLPGMQSRLASLQRASQSFQAGTSLQARMANTPVVGSLMRSLESRRQGKIETLSRSVQIAKMTPAQEARFLTQERLAQLRSSSEAFRNGESLLGRLKDSKVIGRVARGVETRRQGQIARLETELKAGTAPSVMTRVRNATRGRVLPALMLASDGYSVYQGVKHWNDPGNDRKWDDALRIAGNATSAAGDIMAFRRGNIKAAIATHAAGLVISTVGSLFNDQD